MLTVRSDLYSSDKSFKNVRNYQKNSVGTKIGSEDHKRKIDDLNEISDRKRMKQLNDNQTIEPSKSTITQCKEVTATQEESKVDKSEKVQQQVSKVDGKVFSNSMKDAIKTKCKICDDNFTLPTMRSHTKKTHFLSITQYKDIYGQLEAIEPIFHKCALCSHVMILDSGTTAAQRHLPSRLQCTVYDGNFNQGTDYRGKDSADQDK